MALKKQEMLTTRKRLVFLFFIILLAMVSLLGRLGWLQLVRGEELHQQAWEQWNRSLPVSSPRGQILDRNGEVLVGSVTADSVIAIPNQIESKEATARELSRILELDYDEIMEKIEQDTSQVRLARTVSRSKAQHLRALAIPGIEITTESERYYPHGRLASQILGFVGVDQGWGGLEFQYEDILAGKDGWMEFQADGTMRGDQLPHGVQRFIPPEDGSDLKTTIDLNIQYILERELERAMVQYEANQIMAMAMDPYTGEVLAMGAKPDYYPGEYAEFSSEKMNIPVINSTFEPGSTFKLVTLSASIEENKYNPDRGFHCDGSIDVAGTSIGCWSGGHGSIDFLEVVYGSCNPGFVTLGQEIGKETLLRYINGFGFDTRTGIDLPGETTGLIFTEEQMGPTELATTSFGQGVSVTPIQQAVAVSAMANGGNLVRPYIAEEYFENEHSKELEDEAEELEEGENIRQVISESASQQVKEIMEGVVEEGSGQNAFIEGYRIAGKTGTAQKVGPDGGYIPDEHIASFIGFGPVEDPEILIYVAVDNPAKGPAWGGQVAAPVFRNIMEDVIEYKEIPPSYLPEEDDRAATEEVAVPNLINLEIDEARTLIEQKGLEIQFSGEGEQIYEQLPEPGTTVSPRSEITVYLE
ncbi:penicillin-binding transpeptidase domain-containing protein [Natranaerofaba carboxydovora]|uniref:penicillin-binding transpeptidase domain-containing protein n=1 Tax=Natranaerofaba carboxydovora TaxID=2742683 RepID=UPI001F13BC09|nr:penicillin-binding transpeptidase domain-containing protein [Natranaerofaba carboxydovora]UMZ73252.1 Stage V sporulation protein D [Natranaerofaba carboxydovora]